MSLLRCRMPALLLHRHATLVEVQRPFRARGHARRIGAVVAHDGRGDGQGGRFQSVSARRPTDALVSCTPVLEKGPDGSEAGEYMLRAMRKRRSSWVLNSSLPTRACRLHRQAAQLRRALLGDHVHGTVRTGQHAAAAADDAQTLRAFHRFQSVSARRPTDALVSCTPVLEKGQKRAQYGAFSSAFDLFRRAKNFFGGAPWERGGVHGF